MGTTQYPKNRIPIQRVSSNGRRGTVISCPYCILGTIISCPYCILGKSKLLQYGSDKKISKPKIIVETRSRSVPAGLNIASLHARNHHKKSQTEPYWKLLYKLVAPLTLIISTGLLIILFNFHPHTTYANSPTALKSHPLPSTLASWQDTTNSGNYFDQVAPVKVGYLIWSKFPVKVYIETPVNSNQAETWVKTVSSAVQEWNAYLPLEIINQPEVADITITRKSPPLQGNPPRARSAQTTYSLYTKKNFLYHRFAILLSPSQTGNYLLAAARHELGHALGIWGHSKLQSDALYFSQVRNPPLISVRDVNTLKRVYEQPTNLGWSINYN